MLFKRDTVAPQQPTLNELTRDELRSIVWESAGVGIVALALGAGFVKIGWLKWYAIFDWLFGTAILIAALFGLSLVFKDPALEVIARALVKAIGYSAPKVKGKVERTVNAARARHAPRNKVDDDFNTAGDIIDAVFRSPELDKLCKTDDAWRLWSFRALKDAKIIRDNWSTWGRALTLLERAGVLEKREADGRGGKLLAGSLADALRQLNAQMRHDGYTLDGHDKWVKPTIGV